ncbi:MAG: cell division protein FtsA [Candidatus Dadabacteria bacterium]|nr:MAG: cell division protein FtsA [Candidatus Dadabacteria bacterium]
MRKSEPIVGLDIGTTAVKVVIAEKQPDDKINILGVGSSPSHGLRKGVVINIEATVKSIGKAIGQAETMAGIEVNSAFASISGSHIKGFNSHGIVAIRNREVSNYDIEKVIEAAKAVAIPLDREVLHVLPQEYIIDEQDGIKEPLGMSGVRLESRVHLVTGAVASAQNVVKCANRCGLNVNDIVFSPLAASHVVLSPEEEELGVCLIDIGGGTMDVAVYYKGAVKFTTVIPVGGAQISADIAAGLRTPVAAAEEIKCKHGTAKTSEVENDETVEVPSTGGRPPRVLSKSVLAEIIEPRIEEMFTLVKRELVKADCDELLVSGVVLTGGSASLGNLEQVAEEVFGVPVRVGGASGVSGLTDLVRVPEYGTAVGLVVHGAREADSYGRFAARSRIGRAFKKVANWFSEHF